MRGGVVVLVCAVLALLSSFCRVSGLEVSYYEGRSGDIILKPKRLQENPFLILSTTNGKTQSSPLDDTLVSELVSYLIGGPTIQATNNLERDSLSAAVQGLSSVSAFDKLKANLMVTIDGLGSDINDQYPSLKLLNRGKHIPITKTAYPQDSISTMATLATGRTPSQHGIVSKYWNTPIGYLTAYRAQALPTVASVSDIVSQTFGGRSLIVSASSCFQMASSMGIHQFLHTENPFWNVMGFYYDTDNAQFESLYLENPTSSSPKALTLVKEQLVNKLAARKFSAAIQYLETRDITVQVNGASVQFDLGNEVDFVLFAELEFALTLLDQLRTESSLKELVNDNTPDLFFLSFAAISKLKAEYGNDSPQVAAALVVLDEVLNQIIDGFSALYNNKLGNQIVFLGSNDAVTTLSLDENLRDAVYPVVRRNVMSQESFNTFFPIIYLEKGSDNICHEVGKALPNYVEVFCPAEGTSSFPYIDQVIRQSNNSNNTNTSTDNASGFQIVLWMSIVLFLFLYGSVYSLYAMDIGADSLLYRMTAGKSHAN